ncbi:MAG: HAD family hydrolase [Armatimonadetes bacterium]|nr:HAD family hydrolase [Armatimonadota bacterium]
MRSDTVVFWDFDGTLAYRKGGMWGGALRAALGQVCPELDQSKVDISSQLKTGFPWHDPDTPHIHLCEPEAWWRYMQGILANALVKAGVRECEAVACAEIARREYICPSAWDLYDDSIPALSAIAKTGARHVILSNHVPELEWLASELGMAPYLSGVISSALTGYEKPNLQAFKIGLQFAGNPARAFMIGDNPVADVAGAEAAGMTGVLISRGVSATGGRVISHLSDAVILIGS